MSKIVLVGANHAGIAAANTILDNYPGNEVVIIDCNTNLSYLGRGTALWVGQQIPTFDNLFYMNKEAFTSKCECFSMDTDVTSIDFDNKVVYTDNGEKEN